jgi:hypothetical protein
MDLQAYIKACEYLRSACQDCAKSCATQEGLGDCVVSCDGCARACERCIIELEKGSSRFCSDLVTASKYCAAVCDRYDRTPCLICSMACKQLQEAFASLMIAV